MVLMGAINEVETAAGTTFDSRLGESHWIEKERMRLLLIGLCIGFL